MKYVSRITLVVPLATALITCCFLGDFQMFAQANAGESTADKKTFVFGSDRDDLILGAMPGDLDPTFHSDGILTDSFPGSPITYGSDTAIQSNGKIVVVGYTLIGSVFNFAAARYNADGSADTSFSGDGKVNTAVGPSSEGYSVAIQTDGKIVIAGSTNNGSSRSFAVVRYNTDGTLDTSFDGDGRATTVLGTSSQAFSVAIQADGRIVASGESITAGSGSFALVRYNTNGSLDTSFDGDGSVVTAIGDSSYARSVAIQTDGKVVAAGQATTGVNQDFALARYLVDGSLDTTFDGDGKVMTPIGSSTDTGTSVAIQSDGKIVTVGATSNGSNNDFAIARYNSDGSLDTSFDSDGIATTLFGATSTDLALSVAIQTDGKIVSAGYSTLGANTDFAVVRYNTDGSLDSLYGTGGKTRVDIGPQDIAQGVALDSSGKAVVAGYTGTSNPQFAVVRLIGNLAPSAASVSVGGRVTSAEGQGLSGARVVLEDSSGEVRLAITSPFGYFRFDDVEVGQSYLVSVSHKRYEFAPRTVQVIDEMADLTFVPVVGR